MQEGIKSLHLVVHRNPQFHERERYGAEEKRHSSPPFDLRKEFQEKTVADIHRPPLYCHIREPDESLIRNDYGSSEGAISYNRCSKVQPSPD